MSAAREKGASSWLTALPLAEHHFILSKSDFRDALHVRYGWHPPRLPSQCVCGRDFSVDHSFSCSHGGYLGLCHNEVRDLLGHLLRDTCVNTSLEPVLQSLDGEVLPSSTNVAPEARLDIRANGFWSEDRHCCAFFNVRIFHPHALSYRSMDLAQLYRQQERSKRREYEQRVRELERGTFTSSVFSSSGGAAPAASAFLKRLASLLSQKMGASYSSTIGWLRCRLSFALLRCSILCLCGCRSKGLHEIAELSQPDVAASDARPDCD